MSNKITSSPNGENWLLLKKLEMDSYLTTPSEVIITRLIVPSGL